jgi:hypothetical protein
MIIQRMLLSIYGKFLQIRIFRTMDESEFEEILQDPYRDDPQWAPWHANAVDVQVGMRLVALVFIGSSFPLFFNQSVDNVGVMSNL